MDKKYKDVHIQKWKNGKCVKDIYVAREVVDPRISFNEDYISIEYAEKPLILGPYKIIGFNTGNKTETKIIITDWTGIKVLVD